MRPAWVSQLRKGLIEISVLAALRDGEAYGYLLLQQLNGTPGLEVTESTLYPILARLEDERAVVVRVAPSPNGPPRRYYRITRQGQQRLAEMAGHWRQLRDTIDGLLKGAGS